MLFLKEVALPDGFSWNNVFMKTHLMGFHGTMYLFEKRKDGRQLENPSRLI